MSGFQITPPIPVLPVTPGNRYRPHNPAPQVKLEIFIELHCDDSRDQWVIMKQLQSHYGNNKLDLIVHQMPLPYHRNAFLATQGLYLIEDSAVSARLFDYMERSMEMDVTLSTVNTASMTETEVLEMIANMAVSATGISKSQFVSNIDNYRIKAAATWKYGVKRGVAATPTFFLNGVDLGLSSTLPTYQQWVNYLDTIIAP